MVSSHGVDGDDSRERDEDGCLHGTHELGVRKACREGVECHLSGHASCGRAEGKREHLLCIDRGGLRCGILEKRRGRHRQDRDRREEGHGRDGKHSHRIDDRLDDDAASDAAERPQKRCQKGDDEDGEHLR